MHKFGLRPVLLALSVATLPLVAGCGGNPFVPPILDDDELPVGTPDNNTPENTMLRFVATYENKSLAKYEDLFAADFLFTFSSATDDSLVTRYGLTWNKDDEKESTDHLFRGFTTGTGTYEPPASLIELDLIGPQFIPDYSRPDSGDFYKKVIVQEVRLHLVLSDGTEFDISAPHDFYLVRGDVADLDAGQDAGADQWYIHQWDDRDVSVGAVTRLASLNSDGGPVRRYDRTWGSVKATYVATP